MKYLICLFVLFISACGSDGAMGPQGPKGDTGSQGAPGSSCTVTTVAPEDSAPNGGSLISCLDGSQSLVLNGTNGSNGSNGTSGTIVTPVKFCSGTSSYPSTFPEYGFCLSGNLYAVYSTHGGFLTLIPPGVYDSNAVGSKCTFTVKANCVVVDN